MRKTVEIESLVDYVNGILASERNDTEARDLRQGAILVLEQALCLTDNYDGFRYLTNNELPDNIKPGVRYDGTQILDYPERFDDTDDTRRMYNAKCLRTRSAKQHKALSRTFAP